MVNVSEGVDGGVAVLGLTAQVGPSFATTGVMAQESETSLLNPLVDPRVMFEVELTLGSTAEGLGGVACK